MMEEKAGATAALLRQADHASDRPIFTSNRWHPANSRPEGKQILTGSACIRRFIQSKAFTGIIGSMPQCHGRNFMLRLCTIIAALFVASAPCMSVAAEFGTKDEAVAMVKRVQDKFKKDGPEATFSSVTNKDPQFNDRDLYPFIYRLNGVNVAHGARPALVGKNLLNLKDPDGVPLISQMVKIATSSGTGWIDYKWPNPITNVIEDKTSYIEKMGDYFVGVGVYRP